ncbi:RHS repeat domain-containing protein [Melioribacter sp. OK-6-Me]|uniref:RHS repeat domain-containing protein n=1 Tax=unclassified Melioribacter TaxID=2627329 RepID=UPI003ED87886
MKKLFKALIMIVFILMPLITMSLVVQCGNTQENNNEKVKGVNAKTENKPEKSREIKDQPAKELEKAVKLKVKVRRKKAGFFLRNGQKPDRLTLIEELFFNEKGQRTKLIRYTALGGIDLVYQFAYDNKGKLIATEIYDSFGNLTTRKESEYDDKGNEINRRILTSRNVQEERITFQYDSLNHLISEREYYGENLNAEKKYYYDGNLLTKVSGYNAKGQLVAEIEYVYDDKGFLIKEIQKSGSTTNEVVYNYDERGNLITTKNKQTFRQMNYDENNNLIEDKLFLSDGSRQYRVTFSYYKNGLQHEEIRYANNERPAYLAVYEYEFY